MKCFIASAFGRQDVDWFYDRVLAPVLHNLGIEALRVDRVQHNEDIDDKIVQLMNAADFAIADLTHARPSVYYEAGFMQGRGKPVIYTARKDHFRQRDDDEHGNLAIHFDLKMRNIIDWAANDVTVAERVAGRVRYVTQPLREAELALTAASAERLAFQRKSQAEQLRIIREAALALLRVRGFHSDEWSQARCAKAVGKTNVVWDVYARRPFLKKSRETILKQAIINGHSTESAKDFKNLKTTVVCASPGPIPRNPFRAYFSTYAETDAGGLHRIYRPSARHDAPPIPHDVTIRFIDKVESEADFRARFKALLNEPEPAMHPLL